MKSENQGNWQQLQEQLTEKGISIQFKHKGQTNEIQGISFSKGEYTFKGSEIDRSFSFSKLDKYFRDARLTTAGSNKQTITPQTQEPAINKSDNSLLVGLGGLFSVSSSPVDETPDNPDLRKKKKKKRQLSYRCMENNLILEGLLSMVTELKEKQEQQVTPASREETINRLDVIEQRILELQGKPAIPENIVQEILSQIASIKQGQSENQKQDLEDIKGLIVASHRYFKEKVKILFPADTQQLEKIEPSSLYDKFLNRITPYLKPNYFLFLSRNTHLPL